MKKSKLLSTGAPIVPVRALDGEVVPPRNDGMVDMGGGFFVNTTLADVGSVEKEEYTQLDDNGNIMRVRVTRMKIQLK